MKLRVYNPETSKYVNSDYTFVSPDGKGMPVFWGMDFEDVVPVEAELASDVFFGDKELYENDVVTLANGFGLVALVKGKFGVYVANTIDTLLAYRLGIAENELVFKSFDDVTITDYLDTIHSMGER